MSNDRKKVESKLESRIKDLEAQAHRQCFSGRSHDPNKYADLLQGFLQEKGPLNERQQTEGALWQSEEKYRLIFDRAAEGILVIRDGKIAFINRRMLDITGHAPEDIKKLYDEPFLTFVHPEDRAMVLGNYAKRIRGIELPPTYSIRLRKQESEPIWVDLSASAITWEGESAVLLFIADITDRKQTEKTLKESEQKYRDLVENIGEIIYSIDRDGKITYISPICEKILGYQPEEVLGKRALDFIHEEDHIRTQDGFQQAIGGDNGPSEYRMVHKSGELVWVQSYSRPIIDRERIVGIQGVVTDISEQ